jgi:AraC family transcriptional regulator
MDAADPRLSNPIVMQGTAGRILFARMACRLVSHVHREHQVIFHCGGAAADFRVDGVARMLRHGEMILLNPWQDHEKLANPEGASVLLSILFDPAKAGGGLPAPVRTLSFRNPHGVVPPGLRRVLDATMEALMAAPISTAAQREEILLALIRAVADTCLEPGAAREGAAPQRPHDFRIERALRFLLRSGAADMRVDDLPALAGMSRAHFFRQFRRCLGVSPHTVIDYVRITTAIEKLGSRGEPIRAIARDLGFATGSHFARFFAGRLGTSPHRYRRASVREG